MKAHIAADGVLTVTAETQTESFALGCWFEKYNGPEKGRTVLCIQTIELAPEEDQRDRCAWKLRKDGKPAPRTCGLCGLGPCRYYSKEEQKL